MGLPGCHAQREGGEQSEGVVGIVMEDYRDVKCEAVKDSPFFNL